jgi:urate oxidase
MSSSEPGYLSAARYGKDLVRVARVVREGNVHHVVGESEQVLDVERYIEDASLTEYTVRVMLEGQIETSYTEADNKCVVTTDSMKNTVNGEHRSD